MIYSRSAEYAIRAFVYMAALAPEEHALVKNIAADTGIPVHFLAKILQDLARNGYLQSTKGPRGGFRLRLPAEQISMRVIVEAVDGSSRLERCIGGSPECNDRAACGMHDSWVELRSRIIDYLEGTSIADLANALAEKRGEKRRLLPRPRRRLRGTGASV
ncbi:MAG TPA: Rrf2 family transcriptional regulator [Bryobacteraceae bacterium]|nr:Rrf2 family transcriptional regulator [Bryobacteraceae bacterium]